ncbi:MAG TPA: FtsX-like permease family protein, partial [Gemmatimonadaceae bacterium]|nr:FtsX-like permease family protein [Gemmatimonadaceae bacterium]
NVIVLSDRLWREQFNGERSAVGRTARLDGETYTVLGVMPPRFDENTDAWIPLRDSPAAAARDDRQYTAIARLAPNATLTSASADLAAIAGRLAAENPRTNAGWELSPTPFNRLRARESGGGWFQLQAAVAVLLLIAGTNVANLLLARAVARRRELAIRTALGATRWQRFRLVFAEGVILAVLAAALGSVLSAWGTGAVTSLAGLPEAVHVPTDAVTALAAIGLAIVVAIIIALVPATMAARIDANTALNESATRGGSASRGQRRLRTLMLYTEVAAALVLVTGASLMARTLSNRQQRDLGFDPRNALRGEIELSDTRYADPAAVRTAVQELQRTLASQAGIVASGISTFPFASRLGTPTPIQESGGASDLLGGDTPRAIESVSPGFFVSMATPLRRGRDFTPSDGAGGALVAIVNDELARRAWGTADPLGRSLRIAATDAEGRQVTPTVTIVGVVASSLRSSMHDHALPRLYLSFDQFSGRSVTLFVRGAESPERLAGGVKAAVRDVDPALFVEDLRTLESDEAGFLRPTRLYAIMLQLFAGLALLLAAIGIYASMAYSVAQRTRELAIRLALGADPAALVRRVLAEGLRIAIVGGVIGVLLARIGGRMLQSLVYGVTTTDPASFAGAALVLMLVVVAGTWIPARRASVTDPAIALKAD